jgi:hypothetical protein
VFKRSDILVGKEFKVGKLLDERKNWVRVNNVVIKPTKSSDTDELQPTLK